MKTLCDPPAGPLELGLPPEGHTHYSCCTVPYLLIISFSKYTSYYHVAAQQDIELKYINVPYSDNSFSTPFTWSLYGRNIGLSQSHVPSQRSCSKEMLL